MPKTSLWRLCFFCLCSALLFGCSMKSSYIQTPGSPEVPAGARFAVGEITDSSGFEFPPDEKETVDLRQAMGDSLRKALEAKGALAEESRASREAVVSQSQEAKESQGAQDAQDGGVGLETRNSQWTIDVEIKEYAPGNAFARWLMPGLGKTKLSVLARIEDPEGNAAARIPVERSIAMGGGFTIGAWKYVFDEVANELVGVLVDLKRRP
ncbi:MAG: DUF4410 domain-containing protein [Deltaproteobacteria bacterium]|nr:DUF4410 domain-containing protein [Deltaproteobacteria bacterium]